MQKLYCFVDETGQDTLGNLFIVTAVITEKEYGEIEKLLERCERQSGRGKRKWTHTRMAEKIKYLDLVFASMSLKEKVFYQIYQNSKDYLNLTATFIVKTLNLYAQSRFLDDYKAIVLIDGLNQREQEQVTRILRRSGIKTRTVRGLSDEASSIIRLADTIAGLTRESFEGNKVLQAKTHKLSQEKFITQL